MCTATAIEGIFDKTITFVERTRHLTMKPMYEIEEPPLTGNQTIRRGYESEAYIDGGGTEKDDEFPAKEHGVKRVSALYQLPYWRVSEMNFTLCNLPIYE